MAPTNARYALRVALAYGETIVREAMVDERGDLRQELSDDGIHPNNKGYAVMAPLAADAIATAIEGKNASKNNHSEPGL